MLHARLVVWVGLLATSALAVPPVRPAPSDKVTVESRQGGLELAWSDTEERLRGGIHPNPPYAGKPLQVSLHVGSYEGADFEGPLTVTLRAEGSTHGQTQTVRRGEVNWTAEFTPENSGPHQLTISFRTTRLKVVHAKFPVAPAPIPRAILWSVVGLLAVAVVSLGVRSIIREARPAPPPPPTDEPLPEVPPAAPVADGEPGPALEAEKQ